MKTPSRSRVSPEPVPSPRSVTKVEQNEEEAAVIKLQLLVRGKIAQRKVQEIRVQHVIAERRQIHDDLHIDDAFHSDWNQRMHDKPAADNVHSAMAFQNEQRRLSREKEIDGRKMDRFNAMVTLRVTVHGASEDTSYLMVVVNSVYLDDLRKVMANRCGLADPKKFRLTWLDESGEAIELSNQTVYFRYAASMWASHPWVLHVHEAADTKEIALVDSAKVLFSKYDVNNNKSIDKSELQRMVLDLNLQKMQVSEALVKRFVEQEFAKIDADHSKSLNLREFTEYVTSMTSWMREQLIREHANPHAYFAQLAARALETSMEPEAGPAPGGSPVTIEAGKFGVRLTIPPGALPPTEHNRHAKAAIHLVSLPGIQHLVDDPKKRRGEFAFSPIVRVDYPAFADNEAPEVGSEKGGYFVKEHPLVLEMPHCFDIQSISAEESVMMLGAPHGSDHWELIHEVTRESDTDIDACALDGHTMRVQLPYAGLFCAFSAPGIDDISCARLYVFCLPELPRDDPSALRVHLCPELPHMIEEMKLAERAEWGLSLLAGQSKLLRLCEGATFKITFKGQDATLTWRGTRVQAEFTLPQMGKDGVIPDDDDPDRREKLCDALQIDILQGPTRRSQLIQAVAKRAGIPVVGYQVPFETRLDPECRPNAPRQVTLKERTQYDFTLTWKAPKLIDADGDGDYSAITHYAVEIATTTAEGGTYLPWRLLWQGEGHMPPDFKALAGMAPEEANGVLLSSVTLKRQATAQKLAEEKAAEAERKVLFDEMQAKKRDKERAEYEAIAQLAGDAPLEWAGGGGDDALGLEENSVKANKKKKAKGVKTKAKKKKPKEAEEVFEYTLEVSPELFGKLRMRCWCEDDSIPSRASAEVKLERFKGASETKKDETRLKLESIRKQYYFKLCHESVQEPGMLRLGPPASTNTHCGQSIPPPPPTLADLDPKRKKIEMAPVPYDVPQLPAATPGLAAASKELGAFYSEMGVLGGGGGTYCGLTIDQVLHAVVGTPIGDKRSPRRTFATLEHPLIAFCEVLYADVLLPTARDSVVSVKATWNLVDEKVAGIVAHLADYPTQRWWTSDMYRLCQPHLKEIIVVLHEIYETMRQCEPEQIINLHLENINYPGSLKKTLTKELTRSCAAMLWRLSAEFLEMQLDLYKADMKGHKTRAQLARMQLMTHLTATKPRSRFPMSMFR